MAIFTPRGLKIRLPIDHCFALITRLYPNVDAFKFLKTVEGLESIPSFLGFVAGLIGFILKLEPFHIGLIVYFLSVAAYFINLTVFAYRIPFLPVASTMYSYISGFGILLVLLTIIGFILVGWKGVVAFFIGKILSNITNMVIDRINSDRLFKKFGMYVSGSEINFFNAYRFYATRFEKPLDLTLSDGELKKESWNESFEDLAMKWPEVVSRFTMD